MFLLIALAYVFVMLLLRRCRNVKILFLSSKYLQCINTPYIRLVKFQLVRQIPDVYVSACVLAAKLFLLFFLVLVYLS